MDVSVLAGQTAERALRAQELRQEDLDYAEQQRLVRVAVEDNERGLAAARRAELADLSSVWAEQAAYKAGQTAHRLAAARAPTDALACGKSAVQTFVGEDPGKAARARAQHAQVRSWVAQGSNDRAAKAADRAAEEDEYAQLVGALVHLDPVGQEEAHRNATRREVMLENRQAVADKVARKAAAKARDDDLNAREKAHARASALLCEDTSLARSAVDPRRVRRDHFKGMDKATVARYYAENDDVVADRAGRAEQERAEDAAYANAMHEAYVLQEEQNSGVFG